MKNKYPREIFGEVKSTGGHKKGYKDTFSFELLYPTEEFPSSKLVFAIRTKNPEGTIVEKKSFRIDTNNNMDMDNLHIMLCIIFKGLGFFYGTKKVASPPYFFNGILKEIKPFFDDGFKLAGLINDDKSEIIS